jgi:hypothetical protein
MAWTKWEYKTVEQFGAKLSPQNSTSYQYILEILILKANFTDGKWRQEIQAPFPNS